MGCNLRENVHEGSCRLSDRRMNEVIDMETETIVSLAAVVISLLALFLNSKKETKSDAAALARIDASLTSLNTGVQDIRVDLRTMQNDISAHTERLARVEARAESNTHRLDAIEGK